MTWLGLLIGGLIGSTWGFKSTLIGALIGALGAAYLRKSAVQTNRATRSAAGLEAIAPSDGPADISANAPEEERDTDSAVGAAEVLPENIAAAPPFVPVRKGGRGARVYQQAGDSVLSTPVSAAPAARAAPQPLSPPNAVWAWFTGGNALTRIGVVVLFFGVAFLLRYLADIVTMSTEIKLILVAIAGFALAGIGVWLARSRPGYGLSLQGAGAGILYLTVFAAFRQYHVLPLVAGIVLLALVTLLTIALALRADSQPLAGLAVAGGFLAPMLTNTGEGPLLLFGYFAVLNAAIVALAWVRSWRALNLLGFVFTFVLGSAWGYRYYSPDYFATVEPFLILFFAFYVAIAILYAQRGRLEARAPVDGLLVFGVPLAGFALQCALVRHLDHGAAWSAAALASIYAALFLLLRRRHDPGFALLTRAFLALTAIFAVIAVPLIFDYRITAALWAVAAAGVFWLGVRQQTPLVRAFALLVQAAAGVVFLLSRTAARDEALFANAFFVGAMLISLSALLSAWIADGSGDGAGSALPASERGFAPLLVVWGASWWLAGGAFELRRHLDAADAAHATLAWVTASIAMALLLRQAARWRRLLLAGFALLPTMAIVASRDFHTVGTTLDNFGWLLWPLAWIAQWCWLRAIDAPETLAVPAAGAAAEVDPLESMQVRRAAHALSVLGLTAQIAWEASEWVDGVAPSGTVWLACAAILPFIVYLSFTPWFSRATWWPFAPHRDAYTAAAGGLSALLVAAWFLMAAIVSPGAAMPLRYIPLFNPLELTLLLALASLLVWAHRFSRWRDQTIYSCFGAGIFVILNGAVLRIAHQWGDVPWRLSSLLGSRLLQAGLTLAWTATGVVLMVIATRRTLRPLWVIGAGLLAVALAKLALIDLSALSGLPQVIAFLGVGILLIVVGYLSPLPPALSDALSDARSDGTAERNARSDVDGNVDSKASDANPG